MTIPQSSAGAAPQRYVPPVPAGPPPTAAKAAVWTCRFNGIAAIGAGGYWVFRAFTAQPVTNEPKQKTFETFLYLLVALIAILLGAAFLQAGRAIVRWGNLTPATAIAGLVTATVGAGALAKAKGAYPHLGPLVVSALVALLLVSPALAAIGLLGLRRVKTWAALRSTEAMEERRLKLIEAQRRRAST